MRIKSNTELNVLITRPKEKGMQLAQQLKTIGINSLCQSFFDYQSYTSQQKIKDTLTKSPPDIIIFVSVAAVIFANQSLSIKQWLKKSSSQPTQFFAVGHATKKALNNCSIEHVICPKVQNSEGLLELLDLNEVQQKNILIVRGDGGREYLKNTLSKRGAKVNYLESYQRLWLTFNHAIVKQWHANQINVIVITSNALLQRIVDLIATFINTLAPDEQLVLTHWQKNCLWVVASARIAESAKALGLINVINAQGANDKAIIKALS
jgi:uroporphyrinogen-III synthase|tara:strand:- start:265 stop:1059 length:795 start_codon:yes stop_codon:yes gene_type:complete